MRIKISALKSRLQHSPEFDKDIANFLQEIEKNLGTSLEYAEIDDYDCDAKLIFVQTGGAEGLFLQNYDKLQAPYLILTNGSNNSLAASLEILTHLNNNGKHGEILHGSPCYIAKRIRELSAIEHAKRVLSHTKLGVIGKPSNWLISSVPNYDDVSSKLGITLKDIPLKDIEDGAKNANGNLPVDCNLPKFDAKELEKAQAIYTAIKQIVEQNNFDGITIRCFDLLSSLNSTGCLALAKLNSEGIVGTCEGDIMAMISMLIAKLLTGQSSFQANPSRIDVENNKIVFAHCTLPLDMVESFAFDTHFESGIGVAIKGEMKIQPVTVFRMSADLKSYFISNGKIIRNLNESDLCRTQIEVQLDKDVSQLLKTPCGNHHIIVYGEHADLFEQFMKAVL